MVFYYYLSNNNNNGNYFNYTVIVKTINMPRIITIL